MDFVQHVLTEPTLGDVIPRECLQSLGRPTIHAQLLTAAQALGKPWETLITIQHFIGDSCSQIPSSFSSSSNHNFTPEISSFASAALNIRKGLALQDSKYIATYTTK